MRKVFLKKILCIFTAFSFILSINAPYAHANNLVPLSFREMYNLAQSGEVEALRASVRRGMNIDVMDQNGDTGLCIAARRRDSYTYNAFRAAGANPRHPCTQNVDDYEDFINSSQTVPVTSTAREAYSTIGKESYSISPKTWWIIGGIALIGGATAIAIGASGGGGGSKSNNSDKHSEDYNSLGSMATSKYSVKKSTSGSATNTSTLTVENDNTDKIQSIDLSTGTLSSTEYMKAAILAKNGGSYANGEKGIIRLNSGTIGMIAVNKNSEIVNRGYIKADAYNAALGMVASEQSSAVNNASGILSSTGDTYGIDLNLNGVNEKNNYALIGMYADTKSQAVNNGDIRGTASKATVINTGNTTEQSSNLSTSSISLSAAAPTISGMLIGMEGMILNVGDDVKGDEIVVTNGKNGNINISAGDGGTSTTIQLSAFGMTSFIDDNFLNGTENLNRAEIVTIENSGKIELGYTGKYSVPTDTTLRKGTGGIVGIRADANTTATNNGDVNLTFAEYSVSPSTSSGTGKTTNKAIGAGMQAVHRADLVNNGNINVKTISSNPIINYGMLSVEGTGTNSSLYTKMNQKLENHGTITIEASNSFGMASYNGGSLINYKDAKIILGNETDTLYNNNVGMYGSGDGTIVTLTNNGTIDVYSYNSIAMKNDYAGAQTIQNNNTITIHKNATGSTVFGGYYSEAINNGTISYAATPKGENLTPSAKGTADDPFSNYKLQIGTNVLTTKSDASTSSTTEKIYNNIGKSITLVGSSFTSAMSVQTEQGYAENNGTINVNRYTYDSEANSVGMYMDDSTKNVATMINNGTINTESFMSAAMASASSNNAAMINNGTITTKKEYSMGMYAADKTVIRNNGQINITKSNSAAIYSVGNSNVTNNNNINIIKSESDTESLKNVYGIYSKGTNNNLINNAVINIKNSEKGVGMYAAKSDNVAMINNKNGSISVDNGYGIYIAGSNTSDDNSKNETLNYNSGSNSENSTSGNGSENSTSSNDSEKGTSGISILSESNSSGKASVINYGTITVGTGDGIHVDVSGATIRNKGTITVTNGNGIYAVSSGTTADQQTTIINEGTIEVTDGHSIYIEVASQNDYVKVERGNSSSENKTGYSNHNYKESEELDSETTHVDIPVNGENWKRNYKPKDENGGSGGNQKPPLPEPSSVLSFVNKGVFAAKSLNFDNSLVSYSLGTNGSYQADSLAGMVLIDPSVVTDDNSTAYTIENAFVGTDKGIQLANNLYMFNASLQTNNAGNLDAVLSMNDMNDMVKNRSLAEYLSQNYEANKAVDTFNLLKTSATKTQFDSLIKRKFGTGFIPNLAKQNLDTEKTVQKEITDDIMQYTSEDNRNIVNVLTYKNKVSAKGETDGYEDKIFAAYGVKDIAAKDNLRYGFGVAAIRSDSKYDDDSSRYNNMLEAFVPFGLNSETLSAVVKPKIGLARGHYRRAGIDGSHKANTKDYYLGIDTAVKHRHNFGFLIAEPMFGFNLTDLYMEDTEENKNGLNIGSKNVVSAQSVMGLNLKKVFEFNTDNSVTLNAGGNYYHEFGNKYRPSVESAGFDGHYIVKDNRMQRDFGLLNMKAEYKYRQFSARASANVPLEAKHKPYYILNLGYAF